MPSCFECPQIFLDNKSLLRHINFAHPLLGRYECHEKNCSRTFSLYNSFYKHVTKMHKDVAIKMKELVSENQDSICCEMKRNITESPIPKFFEDSIENEYIDVLDESCEISADDDDIFTAEVLDSSITEMFEPVDSQREKNSIESFRKFVAELYSFGEVNRKRIHKIIYADQMLLTDTLDNFEKDVSEVFNVGMEQNGFDCRIKKIADSCKKPLVNFDSES